MWTISPDLNDNYTNIINIVFKSQKTHLAVAIGVSGGCKMQTTGQVTKGLPHSANLWANVSKLEPTVIFPSWSPFRWTQFVAISYHRKNGSCFQTI